MEAEGLRSLVAQLETELKEREKDAHTAAELGKKLLESNQELQTQLDENFKTYSERIEVGMAVSWRGWLALMAFNWTCLA